MIRSVALLWTTLSMLTICQSRKIPDRILQYQSTLKERFAIQDPIFTYKELQFDLDFVVSDLMGDSYIQYQIYDGHLCREGDNDITLAEDNNYLYSRLRPDLQPVGTGDGFRTMKVTVNIDPANIASSPVFEDFETYGVVKFCVRFSNYNTDFLDPQSIETNFIETQIQLNVNLVDDFVVDIGEVRDSEIVLQMATQDTAVEAYICDSESNIVEGAESKSQGETVRVCIVPTQQAMAEGAYLRFIETFEFRREPYTQVAIEPDTFGSPANSLTIVDCISGSDLCAFETLLSAEFFLDGEGTITGSGMAYLQFGTEEIVNQRNLQDFNGRTAQQVLAEEPTGFSFDIRVVPVSNRARFQPSGAQSHLTMFALALTSFLAFIF